MTFYLSVFTPLLAMVKVGALIFGRLYIVKQEPKEIECNFTKDTLYVVGQMGLIYVALFAAQLIITAEAVRITVYEGAIAAEIFETVKQTTCRSILTCCHKTPENNIFAIDDDKAGAKTFDDSEAVLNQSTSPLKGKSLELSATKDKGGRRKALGVNPLNHDAS